MKKTHKITKLSYQIVFIFGLILGTGCSGQHNIYEITPKGSKLTQEILQKSRQIIPSRSELVLVFSNSNYYEHYDPHLLFFNDSLKLYAACYLPSEKVTLVDNRTFSGTLSSYRDKRRNWFQNDLPPKYNLELVDTLSNSSYGRKSNKIVESMEFIPEDTSVKMHILASENQYIGLRGKKLLNDSTFLANYTYHDTLIFPLAELVFDKEEMRVSVEELSMRDGLNRLLWDHMLVKDQMILDGFYRELYLQLQSH